jgi:hypothetical protein
MAGPAPTAKAPTGTSGAYGVFRSAIPNGQKIANPIAAVGSGYNNAVKTAFTQASPAAKAAIIAGARANPNLPSSKVVLSTANYNHAARTEHGGLLHALGTGAQFVEGLLSHGANTNPSEQLAQQMNASKPELAGMGVSARLGQQVLALPKTAGEGALATIKAGVHDAEHPAQTIEHPLHSATFQLGKQMVTGDPWVHLITTGSTSGLAANPLGAILDVSGVGSLAGKAAEVGALGDAAKAAMERPDVVVPGTNTRLIRPNYSTSPIIHAAQRLSDFRAGDQVLGSENTRYLTNPVQAFKRGPEINPQAAKALDQRVDEDYYTGHATQQRALAQNMDATDAAAKLLDGIPGGHELVGHLEDQLPHDHAAAEKLMQDNLAMWEKSLQDHKDAGGQLKAGSLFGETPEANLQQNIASMQNGLKLLHDNPSAFDRVVEAARIRAEAQRQNVEQVKADQAVSDPVQLERRRVLPYAQRVLGAVHTDTLTDKPLSEAGQAAQHLDAELKDAFAENKSIGRLGRPETVDHPDVKPYANNLRVTRAQLKATKARLSEAKGPIRKANLAQRAEALKQLRDEQVRDLRTRQLAARADVTDKIKGLQDARSTVSGPKYLHGWVVPAEHAPADEAFQQAAETGAPIGGVSPLGREYVPLDTQAALQHAEEHGITPGYIAAGHSTEEALQRIKGRGGASAGSGLGRGGTTTKYLGDSYIRGTANRTLAGSHDSAVAGLNQIARAADHDRLLRTGGLVDQSGELRTFPADAQGYSDAAKAAKAFEAEHPGFKISVVPRYPDRAGNTAAINDIQDVAGHEEDANQRLALVHDQAIARQAAHEESSKLIKGVGMINQIWRGGVLPFSPNYLQAVPQEGIVRTAVAGINPLRTLPGFSKLPGLRANHLDDLMTGLKHASEDPTVDPATRAMYRENHNLLQNLSGGGLNFGAQDQVLRETLDKLRGGTMKDVSDGKKLAQGLQRLVMKPGQWQLKNMHKLENLQSRAVLNDWVKDAEKTQGSMQAVIKALGDGKHGANLAATAGHRMNEVLGNYIHRTPLEQTLIRNFTPFLSWYKNAVKFMYVTMPRDHPIMTQFLANVGTTNAQAWQQDHSNLASFLSTDFLGTNYGNALETVGGVDPLRNTPAGIGETSPLSELGLVAPSAMPLLYGALGLNSFGQPIPTNQYGHSVPPGGTQAFLQGVLPNLLSEVPYYNLGSHIVKGLTGTQSKADVVSHNAAIRAIEEVFGGSMMPKNYSVYNHAKAASIKSPFGGGAFGGGSAFGGGGALGGGSALGG